VETHNFWHEFADLPQLEIDTAAIARRWRSAKEAVQHLLDAKMASPLEAMSISAEALSLISEYNAQCDRIRDISDQISAMNAQLALIKEQSIDANTAVLASDLANLKAVEARYQPPIKDQCDDYLAEKAAKAQTESKRDMARQALDQHRQSAFPAYGVSINEFLRRFNANFRVGPIDPVNNRGGSAANYTLLIDNHPVPLSANTGEASFRNTLSAGDRSTLALAFFFACLEQNPQRAQAIAVIDDPMNSLDEHRTLHTIQEIDRLAREISSMIILSHSKPFLFQVWDKCRQIQKASLEVARSGQGSTLMAWNVTADIISEHEKRHAAALAYLEQADRAQERKVAESLRPMLEAFCRVAYPNDFLPRGLLGPFHEQCERRLGTREQIMDAGNTAELRDLLDYANRYHHDSNPAYATEVINDATLTDFTQRTLRFIKRP
jgi:wobble nucleotide-excising tRNase